MDAKVSKLLNEQINKELFSAYLYLEMADYYSDSGLDGFENWFYVQAQEENDHAMLFRKYMLNNGEKIKLTEIAAPAEKYTSFDAPLKKSLEHEKTVTASIYNIYQVAEKAGDIRTLEFLNWFVKEQGEEEKNADDLIKKFTLFAGDPRGLYELNQELKTRVYSAPGLVLE